MQIQSKQTRMKENKKAPSAVEAVKRSTVFPHPVVKKSKVFENREVLRCLNAPVRTSEEFPIRHTSDCDVYSFEIHEYLRSLETKLAPDYMSNSADRGARRFVLDWIVNAHRRYHLRTDTLHRTISYFDHYVQSVRPDNSSYQLVALTCLVVSSKYEETYIPSLDEFLYMTDNSYEKDELLESEQRLLVSLSFELGHPTPVEFLRRACAIAQEGDVIFNYALFLIELAFFDVELIREWTPSQLASVAFYVSMVGHGIYPAWTPALNYHLQVNSDFVAIHSRDLCLLVEKVAQEYGCHAVYQKYSSAVMGRVGTNSYRATTLLRNNGYCNDQENRPVVATGK